jgi:hypothetical protein
VSYRTCWIDHADKKGDLSPALWPVLPPGLNAPAEGRRCSQGWGSALCGFGDPLVVELELVQVRDRAMGVEIDGRPVALVADEHVAVQLG